MALVALKAAYKMRLRGRRPGVASTFPGLESLSGEPFVCVIRFILAKEDGGGECLEERAVELGGD